MEQGTSVLFHTVLITVNSLSDGYLLYFYLILAQEIACICKFCINPVAL
jgi:hypothetical protein